MSQTIRKNYIDCSYLKGGTPLRLHYREGGRPERPPLLLLHQNPSSSVMYEKLIAELEQYYWVLAPDTPGFGSSDAVPLDRPLEITDYAAAVKSFLVAKGIERCYVFGHHSGASIAVQLEHDYPGTAMAMSLSGPPLLSDEMKNSLPSAGAAIPVKQDGTHLLAMWERMSVKDVGADLALIQREMMLGFASGENYQAAYKAVARQEFSSQLGSIVCPVQVFAGNNDPLFGSVEPTLSKLSNARPASLKGDAATYVCDVRPVDIAYLLKDIFS